MRTQLISFDEERGEAVFGFALGLAVTALVRIRTNERRWEALLMSPSGGFHMEGSIASLPWAS